MIRYFKESFAELNNVTWPTRKQGIKITIIVLAFMILSAAVLGVVDYLYSMGIETLINDQVTTPQIDATTTPAQIETTPVEINATDTPEADNEPSSTTTEPNTSAEAPTTNTPSDPNPIQ